MASTNPQFQSRTWASLSALVAGLAVSWLIVRFPVPALSTGTALIESIGLLWVNALRLAVLPIIISQLFLAVVTTSGGKAVGRLGALSALVFVVLLVLAALFTLIIIPPMLSLPGIDNLRLTSGQARQPESPGAPVQPGQNMANWLSGLISPGIVDAAGNNVLAMMGITLVLAVACTRIAPEPRQLLISFTKAVADAAFVIMGWLIRFAPLGIFAFALGGGARSGMGAGLVLITFAAILSVNLVLFTLVLYPITRIAGRVPMRTFARAVLPAQVVAVGTRSSVACVPILMDHAERVLALPASVTGFVFPFAAAAFKVNRTLSCPVELLFLAHVFRVELTPAQIAAYLAAIFLMSFSTAGIPSGGMAYNDLPFILAAGIPVEGYMLLKAIDMIPDLFKTLANVTGYMSASAIVARFATAVRPAHTRMQGA